MCRLWLFAKPGVTNAPSGPSRESTAAEPSFHFVLVITLPRFGSVAVTWIVLPKARPSPPRMLVTSSTPGAFAAAAATLGGIGEKLFCAVIA